MQEIIKGEKSMTSLDCPKGKMLENWPSAQISQKYPK
jgi:hypothetical protein